MPKKKNSKKSSAKPKSNMVTSMKPKKKNVCEFC